MNPSECILYDSLSLMAELVENASMLLITLGGWIWERGKPNSCLNEANWLEKKELKLGVGKTATFSVLNENGEFLNVGRLLCCWKLFPNVNPLGWWNKLCSCVDWVLNVGGTTLKSSSPCPSPACSYVELITGSLLELKWILVNFVSTIDNCIETL